MGKKSGHSFKYNRFKMSTSTLKKPVLSSSAAHTSSARNFSRTFISSHLDNKDSTAIQNKKNTSNTDDIHSCITPQKQHYSVQATSTTPHLKPLNTTLPIVTIESHTTTKIPLVGKEYLCFQINSKSPHAAQCVKPRILNKATDSILYIDTFEQKIVVIKCMLQSSRLEDHMKTIDIDQ